MLKKFVEQHQDNNFQQIDEKEEVKSQEEPAIVEAAHEQTDSD